MLPSPMSARHNEGDRDVCDLFCVWVIVFAFWNGRDVRKLWEGLKHEDHVANKQISKHEGSDFSLSVFTLFCVFSHGMVLFAPKGHPENTPKTPPKHTPKHPKNFPPKPRNRRSAAVGPPVSLRTPERLGKRSQVGIHRAAKKRKKEASSEKSAAKPKPRKRGGLDLDK